MDSIRIQYIFRYVIAVTTLIGLIGNIACLISLCTRKRKKLRSSTVYLYALVWADLAFLCCLVLDKLRWLGYDLRAREGACETLTYFSNTCATLSAHYIAVFTVERYLVVRNPLQRQMISARRAVTVVWVTTVVGVALNCYVPFITSVNTFVDESTNTTFRICDIRPGLFEIYAYLNTADLVWTFAIPLCIIVILNTAIIKLIVEASQFRRMYGQCCPWSLPSTGYLAPSCRDRTYTNQSTMTAASQQNTACCLALIELWTTNAYERRTTLIVLLLSLTYLLLNLPVYAYRVYEIMYMHDFTLEFSDSARTVGQVSSYLFYLQYCVNFFFYSMLNQMCGLKRGSRKRSQNININTSSTIGVGGGVRTAKTVRSNYGSRLEATNL